MGAQAHGSALISAALESIDTVFAELGFPDPRGSNRHGLERALKDTAEAVASYLSGVSGNLVSGRAGQGFDDPLPEKPQPFPSLLKETFERIVGSSMHLSHPRYMAHMDSGVAFAGIVGDFLAAALNQNMLAKELSPAATAVEHQVVRWFCQAAGLPPESGGTFVGGGTMANVTALLAARDRTWPQASRSGLARAPRLCVLASVESHYSLQKAAAILGLGSEAVIPVAADAAFRMSAGELRSRIAEERRRGSRPIAVVGTAGTTSTGSIDPLPEIAAVARQEGLWFHVDASHGGALLFSEHMRGKLAGIESADSIAFDPHKWLWAPKSAGIFVLRDFRDFSPARYEAPYLDREGSQPEVGRGTIEGSRPFDSLKVWMILRHLGTRRIARVLQRNCELTAFLHDRLAAGRRWAPLHRPEMNVLCFAGREAGSSQEESYRRLLETGEGWVSLTKVGGRKALRTVILNPSTREEDLEQILRLLQ